MKISYLIVTKNNSKTIEKTLKSLPGNILAIDLESKDDTINMLKKYDVEYVVKNTDRQNARNELTKMAETEWVFHLEPWEILIENIKSQESGYVQIFNNTLITKETRFWNKKQYDLKFENPLYPQVPDHITNYSGAILLSQGARMDLEEGLAIIEKWQKAEPKNKFIPYYKSFLYWENKQYKQFISAAEEYLYLKNQFTIESINLKYCLANAYFYIKNNPKKATEIIMECIVTQPAMAEYWCFVGDVMCFLGKYDKAKSFYNNAILMGEKRENDWNSIEIEKYKEYPTKRIAMCQEIIQQTLNSI